MAAGQASTGRRRIRAVVRGQVQGVAYRASTQAEALRLRVVGFVSNQADGSVLLEAEGDSDDLETLLAWCTHGPRLARVDTLEVQELAPRHDAGSFTIRR